MITFLIVLMILLCQLLSAVGHTARGTVTIEVTLWAVSVAPHGCNNEQGCRRPTT